MTTPRPPPALLPQPSRTNDMEELKACPNPWCFSMTAPIPVSSNPRVPGRKVGWRVNCACGIKTHRETSKAEAIAAWNRRSTPPAMGVDREAVERLSKAAEAMQTSARILACRDVYTRSTGNAEAFAADIRAILALVGGGRSGSSVAQSGGTASPKSDGLCKSEDERDLLKLAEMVWQGLLDADDRNSPAEYPDMVLITRQELGSAMGIAAIASNKGGAS